MKERILYNDLLTEEEENDIIEGYAECNDVNIEDIDEELKYAIISDYLEMDREDLDINCNVYLANPILVIADVGTWDGRKTGYKIINSGLLSDIFHMNDECDYHKYYSDGYNIHCKAIHYDGTNYYEFREIKNMDNIDTFLDNLLNDKYTNDRRMLNYYTKSILPEFKKIYGF